jgi:tetratricopeptide (TPR) repeat protein
VRRLALLLLAVSAGAQETPLGSAERKLEAEDYAGAIADFDKAIEGAPGDARGYAGRGRALQMLDRDEDAIKDFSKAIELAPKPDPGVLVWRAISHWVLDHHDAAIEDCGKAIELAPRNGRAYYIRGEARRGKREEAAALKDFDKTLELEPKHPRALQARGGTKEALRDFDGALEDYTRLVELDPDDPVAFVLRAGTKMRLGIYEGALEDLDAALFAEDPDDPDRGLHVARARALLALGRKEAAETELAKAAEPPEDADAIEDRGRYYFDTGRPKEAAADLSKAIRMDPTGHDYARLFLFLARSKLGESAPAADELKTYVGGREKKDDWYSTVAGFLCGRLTEADLFAAAKSGSPQIAIEQGCEASWYAGSVRLLAGDAAGAKALFERCVKTDVRTFIEYESAKAALGAMK